MRCYVLGDEQSFEQPAHCSFRDLTGWDSTPTDLLRSAQPEQQPTAAVAGQARSRGFPHVFRSTQGLPQSLGFPHYSPVSVDQKQSFGLAQPLALNSNSTDFSMGLPQNAPYSFEGASAQSYAQQTSPGASIPPGGSHLSGPESPQNGLYQSLNGFQFNPSIDTTYGQTSLNNILSACNTAITTSDNAHSDYIPTASQNRNSPSRSHESLTDISSPASEFAAHRDVSVSNQLFLKEDARVCQWRLAGDQVCGKRFNQSAALYKHVAELHVSTLKANEDHGFICRWEGCGRLINKNGQSKQGFDTKSKVKRHIEIHTGPRKSPPVYCAFI